MLRRVVAIVAGIVAATVCISLVERLGHLLFPLDSALLDSGEVAAAITALPLAAKLIVVAGWFLGTLAGGWLALRLCDWTPAGWTIAALALVAVTYQIAVLPFPWPIVVLAILAPPAGGWLAQRWHRAPRPGEPLIG